MINLENRHTTILQWDEPRRGKDAQGNEVTAHVTMRATVHDCINMARFAEDFAGPTNTNEAELLNNFIAVNWAHEANDETK